MAQIRKVMRTYFCIRLYTVALTSLKFSSYAHCAKKKASDIIVLIVSTLNHFAKYLTISRLFKSHRETFAKKTAAFSRDTPVCVLARHITRDKFASTPHTRENKRTDKEKI